MRVGITGFSTINTLIKYGTKNVNSIIRKNLPNILNLFFIDLNRRLVGLFDMIQNF